MNALREAWNACTHEVKWAAFLLVCVAVFLFWCWWVGRGISKAWKATRGEPFDVWSE